MRVGIIGVTGYTGSELLRLLFLHKNVELPMSLPILLREKP